MYDLKFVVDDFVKFMELIDDDCNFDLDDIFAFAEAYAEYVKNEGKN